MVKQTLNLSTFVKQIAITACVGATPYASSGLISILLTGRINYACANDLSQAITGDQTALKRQRSGIKIQTNLRLKRYGEASTGDGSYSTC